MCMCVFIVLTFRSGSQCSVRGKVNGQGDAGPDGVCVGCKVSPRLGNETGSGVVEAAGGHYTYKTPHDM